MRRIARWGGRCFLAVLAVFLVLCTTNEIRQRILVRWAGALLSDIHSLRLRESKWNDAERLMTRWGRWGHQEGLCSPQRCFYTVTLESPMMTATSQTLALMSAFRLSPRQWAGGLIRMDGMFLVQDGLIVRSGASIELAQSPLAKGAQEAGGGGSSVLVLSVLSHGSLGLPEPWKEPQRSRHPDYATWRPDGCSSCVMGRVTYADSMPAEEAAKLSDFQLSCATRWNSCLSLEELDPAAQAWHLYSSPRADEVQNTASKPVPVGCSMPAYALGRDANRIVRVEALDDGIGRPRDCDGFEHESSHVRVLGAVKGESPWQIGSVQEVISSGSSFHEAIRKPAHLVKGREYMLILGEADRRQDDSSLGNCGIIEADGNSEREVRRGVAMDDRIRGPEPSVSLSGFAPRPTGLL